VLALGDFAEAFDGIGQLHVLALIAGELLGHMERLRKKALDLAGACHRQLVLIGKLVDTENGDDVLQILVPLENSFHRLRRVVVVVAQDQRIENAAGGRQRVDRGINAQRSDIAREVRGGVEVRERRGWRGIGIVVGT